MKKIGFMILSFALLGTTAYAGTGICPPTQLCQVGDDDPGSSGYACWARETGSNGMWVSYGNGTSSTGGSLSSACGTVNLHSASSGNTITCYSYISGQTSDVGPVGSSGGVCQFLPGF